MVSRRTLLGFWVSVLLVVGFCHCDDKSVEVVGIGECADCEQTNINSIHAFSGLHVAIDCKVGDGKFKTIGVGELDNEGKFKVNLPGDIAKGNGELKEECYAQLHSASRTPCPTHSGLEASKIIFKSKDNGKHTFGPAGKLAFSPITCTSAFLWPYFKYPPLPKLPPLKFFGHPFYYTPKVFPPLPPKVFPPIYKKPLPPPIPIYKKPLLPPIPIYKKPLPPPFPIFKKPLLPPIPVYKKPLPPPIPIYKKPLPPLIPIYKKPLPPPIPVYKKPLPPLVPVYKKPLPPLVPVYKKPLPPPVPIYKKPPHIPFYKLKPPIYKKPLPPIPKIPPVYKKPSPPIPKLPPLPKLPPIHKKPLFYKKPLPHLPKLPPISKIPAKYFHHPKLGYWPPLPPFSSHP